jgi:MFS family permease
MGGVWAISATITGEIFPTHMRATANAVANNVLGRLGCVLSPSLVGWLSSQLGSVGDAISVVVWGNVFICVPILLLLLPETKGKALEEIAERTQTAARSNERGWNE